MVHIRTMTGSNVNKNSKLSDWLRTIDSDCRNELKNNSAMVHICAIITHAGTYMYNDSPYGRHGTYMYHDTHIHVTNIFIMIHIRTMTSHNGTYVYHDTPILHGTYVYHYIPTTRG